MRTRTYLAIAAFLILVKHGLAAEIERGTPEAPQDAKTLAGRYYVGTPSMDGVTLTLMANGNYAGVSFSCIDKSGTASGAWKLVGKRVVLSPSKETGHMKGYLTKLDVLKYKNGWIFVRAKARGSGGWLDTNFATRKLYDKLGVSRFSCFQGRSKK